MMSSLVRLYQGVMLLFSGLDRIMGPTITTIPLRIRLDRNQSILEYLESVQAQAIEMIPIRAYRSSKYP